MEHLGEEGDEALVGVVGEGFELEGVEGVVEGVVDRLRFLS